MKRKKKTHAYKIGYTDGCNRKYRNNYAEGSAWYNDYERGYTDGLKVVAKLKEAKSICDQVIQPNIERINKAIGQENDPMYLSYMCEYVVSQGGV